MQRPMAGPAGFLNASRLRPCPPPPPRAPCVCSNRTTCPAASTASRRSTTSSPAPSRALVDDLARGRRRPHDPRRRRQDGADAGPPGASAPRPTRRVIGVARFSDPAVRDRLEAARRRDDRRRPARPRRDRRRCRDVPNVVFAAGHKFGASGNPALTWAMNTLVPALVAERFRDGAHRRLLDRQRLPAHAGRRAQAASEATPPAPVGEYAQSCLGRERMFEYFSARHGTPGRIVPPQLRDRHALRRARRHRRARSSAASRST